MSTNRSIGEIITFYSYKGGTGRTMALANIACLLTKDRKIKKGLLMIDWDLEAPGLHRFFYPSSASNSPKFVSYDESFEKSPGLIDLFVRIKNLIDTSLKSGKNGQTEEAAREIFNQIDIWEYIQKTNVPNVYQMKAGCFDEEYSNKVNTFKWDELYKK